MKEGRMLRRISLIGAIVLWAGFSVAQSGDRVNVFGGFSYVRPDFTGSASGGSGFDAEGSVKVVSYLRAVGDFSGFFPQGSCACGPPSARYYMFLGGPEVAVRTGRIQPFAHFLLGYTHGSLTYGDDQGGGPTFGHFTAGAGGGLDVGINRRFAVRAQADWLHIDQSYVSTNDPYLSGSNVARISTGLVVRF
jgi:hypothetical protein